MKLTIFVQASTFLSFVVLIKLFAIIDPTAPNNLFSINPITAIFDPVGHQVFSTLEPLVNVHKQQSVAEVIKSFVAGQHFAGRVHIDVYRAQI